MSRVFLQFALILLPFILFGLYRLAIAEAEQEGRKPWPIRVLFGTGLALFLISWFGLLMLDRGGEAMCYTPRELVDGEIVGGEAYPCEKDISQAGIPRSDNPGGDAAGVDVSRPAMPE